jgi:hypothetical protein
MRQKHAVFVIEAYFHFFCSKDSSNILVHTAAIGWQHRKYDTTIQSIDIYTTNTPANGVQNFMGSSIQAKRPYCQSEDPL